LEEIRQLLDLYKSDQDPQIQIKQAHERAERQLKALEAKKQELEEIIDDLRSQLAWGKNLLSTRAPLKPAIRHFDQ
jgi:DNA-binding transcriptional MerR regulator